MEDQRLAQSGFSSMPTQRSLSFSPFILAALSVSILGSVVVWSIFGKTETASAPTTVAAAMQSIEEDPGKLVSTIASRIESESTMPIEDIGPMVVGTLATQYSVLKEQGLYTPETGEMLGQKLAQAVYAPVSYKKYSVQDLKLSDDASYERMLSYRAELKDALVPLTEIKEPEIGIFAGYIESRNPAYLDALRETAAKYSAAIALSAKLEVPRDAAEEHAGILNAMGQFGAVLTALADNADDPITSTVLLQTFNEGEETMVASFNNLAMYYAHHPKP